MSPGATVPMDDYRYDTESEQRGEYDAVPLMFETTDTLAENYRNGLREQLIGIEAELREIRHILTALLEQDEQR